MSGCPVDPNRARTGRWRGWRRASWSGMKHRFNPCHDPRKSCATRRIPAVARSPFWSTLGSIRAQSRMCNARDSPQSSVAVAAPVPPNRRRPSLSPQPCRSAFSTPIGSGLRHGRPRVQPRCMTGFVARAAGQDAAAAAGCAGPSIGGVRTGGLRGARAPAARQRGDRRVRESRRLRLGRPRRRRRGRSRPGRPGRGGARAGGAADRGRRPARRRGDAVHGRAARRRHPGSRGAPAGLAGWSGALDPPPSHATVLARRARRGRVLRRCRDRPHPGSRRAPGQPARSPAPAAAARPPCSRPCCPPRRRTSASWSSRTSPSCASRTRTSSRSRPGRRTSTGREASDSTAWCGSRSGCGPTASSSASAGERNCASCSARSTPVTTAAPEPSTRTRSRTCRPGSRRSASLAGMTVDAVARQSVSAFDAVLHIERDPRGARHAALGAFGLDRRGRLAVQGGMTRRAYGLPKRYRTFVYVRHICATMGLAPPRMTAAPRGVYLYLTHEGESCEVTFIDLCRSHRRSRGVAARRLFRSRRRRRG